MPHSTFTHDASPLAQTTHGVLSCIDAQGNPYAVALNAVYHPEENCLYFHCKPEGRKVDALAAHPRVAYLAIVHEELVPERFTTRYTSVLAEGTARRLSDEGHARAALAYLTAALAPEVAAEERDAVIDAGLSRCALYRIDIETTTCKTHG